MGKTILIVDDSATLRMSVDMTLGPAGYEVVQAVNGVDGLAKLHELGQIGSTPALVISDINMPEMDGITFIGEVKKTEFRYLPIIVLTSEREDDMKMKGKAAGASGWLVKPFKPDTLLAVVAKFTRSLG